MTPPEIIASPTEIVYDDEGREVGTIVTPDQLGEIADSEDRRQMDKLTGNDKDPEI